MIAHALVGNVGFLVIPAPGGQTKKDIGRRLGLNERICRLLTRFRIVPSRRPE